MIELNEKEYALIMNALFSYSNRHWYQLRVSRDLKKKEIMKLQETIKEIDDLREKLKK